MLNRFLTMPRELAKHGIHRNIHLSHFPVIIRNPFLRTNRIVFLASRLKESLYLSQFGGIKHAGVEFFPDHAIPCM